MSDSIVRTNSPQRPVFRVERRSQSKARLSEIGKGSAVALYVQGESLGFVTTKLRVLDESSLSAVYSVVETSALGTLSRKHFWFVFENEGVIKSAVPAYLVHYHRPDDALRVSFGGPKLLKRRSFQKLLQSLASDRAVRESERLVASLFPQG